MRCEICGKKIIGTPLKTKIDGSVMLTCKECSKFGKVQREPQKPRRPGAPRKTGAPRRRPRPAEPTYEVVEDCNVFVRQAREKKKWSREELAEKIYEKASVINRIESGKMIPDIKLARKLERILGITLLEKNDGAAPGDIGHLNARGATIGDIARIKKR